MPLHDCWLDLSSKHEGLPPAKRWYTNSVVTTFQGSKSRVSAFPANMSIVSRTCELCISSINSFCKFESATISALLREVAVGSCMATKFRKRCRHILIVPVSRSLRWWRGFVKDGRRMWSITICNMLLFSAFVSADRVFKIADL